MRSYFHTPNATYEPSAIIFVITRGQKNRFFEGHFRKKKLRGCTALRCVQAPFDEVIPASTVIDLLVCAEQTQSKQ